MYATILTENLKPNFWYK